MLVFIIVKLLLVLMALVMFLRRPNVVWGIGLLTVTSAILLDTFLGTFGREEMLAELGFFFYLFAGFLFTGAALWAWGLLRPLLGPTISPATNPPPTGPPTRQPALSDVNNPSNRNTAFDRQMLYDEIRHRFGYEDVLDLIFDLGLNENEVMTLGQEMNHLIINVMNRAEDNNQTGALALAVERILTPPPPENLPRLEKIDVDSPPTILRHYLLANFNLAQLERLVADLKIDWEQLASTSKKAKVRDLLNFLYRRNRIDEMVDLLHQSQEATAE